MTAAAMVVAVMAATTACGDGGRSEPIDGTPGDAPVPDAAPPGTVRVTTHVRCCGGETGDVIGGIDIVLIDADGTARDPVTTDAEGNAQFADVAPGATVTAVYPETVVSWPELVTVVGVEPGDHLQFGEGFTPFRPSGGLSGDLVVSWPELPGAAAFTVIHPCGLAYGGEGATSVTVHISDFCYVPTADLLVLAFGTEDFLGSARLVGAPYVPDAALEILDWTPATPITVSATTIPAVAAPDVEVRLSAWIPGSEAFPIDAAATAAGGAISLAVPQANAASQLIGSLLVRHATDSYGPHQHNVVATGNAAAIAVPVGELPWLGPSVADLDSHTVGWIQDGAGDYDGAVIETFIFRPDPDGVGGREYHGLVLLPPGVTSWSWGTPPPSLAEYAPQAGDTFGHAAQLVDLADAAGYAGLRQIPEWIYSCPRCAAERGDLVSASGVAYTGGNGPDPEGRHAGVGETSLTLHAR
jgi:hypothetical protein